MNEQTVEQLVSHLFNVEGFRATPYRCSAGKLTVGVGFNLDDREDGREMLHSAGVDISRYPTVTVTKQQAWGLTRSLVGQHYHALVRKFPWVAEKPEDAKFVLVDLSFNMGLGALSRFRNFLGFMERGEYAPAALELLIRGNGDPSPTPYFSRVGTNRAFPLVAKLATLDERERRRPGAPVGPSSLPPLDMITGAIPVPCNPEPNQTYRRDDLHSGLPTRYPLPPPSPYYRNPFQEDDNLGRAHAMAYQPTPEQRRTFSTAIRTRGFQMPEAVR